MRPALSALALLATLAVAACSGGATAAPSSPASEPPASAPPSEPAATSAADPCAPSTDAGTVSATIVDFSFSPATVTAKVGDVVVWTNEGEAPHTATLDDQSACDTGTLAGGASGGIVFQAPGTYAFHCAIHASMKGTVEVSA